MEVDEPLHSRVVYPCLPFRCDGMLCATIGGSGERCSDRVLHHHFFFRDLGFNDFDEEPTIHLYYIFDCSARESKTKLFSSAREACAR